MSRYYRERVKSGHQRAASGPEKCCEHCCDTAEEVLRIYSGEYSRGRAEALHLAERELRDMAAIARPKLDFHARCCYQTVQEAIKRIGRLREAAP